MKPYFIDSEGILRTKQDVFDLIDLYEKGIDEKDIVEITELDNEIHMYIYYHTWFKYFKNKKFKDWSEVWKYMLRLIDRELPFLNVKEEEEEEEESHFYEKESELFDFTEDNARAIRDVTVSGLRDALIEDMGLGMF